MTRILLMLLLPVVTAPTPEPPCPVSCVVCSEDAVICQSLTRIIDAPNSTQALLLTEGSISTVQPAALSDLNNLSIIGLSHNRISELGREPFKKLLLLHTLLLDHNLLTGPALQGGALTNLTQLRVLALGHNLISMIQADWLKGTKALVSLKLEGNQLTRLDFGSFSRDDLKNLESLDLSDNLIEHLDKNSFQRLLSLRTLDLSRNRLSSAPAEAFSYLSWLTSLNLERNSWNCTCELLELAAVLASFLQDPAKTLYNGRRLVCVSADNPAVTTVLELTDVNCVPSNQNITVQIESRGAMSARAYARDIAITAAVCFIGGVALTLLCVLICFQISRKKKLKDRQQRESQSGTLPNGVSHRGVDERSHSLFLEGRSEVRDRSPLDTQTDRPFKLRADENGSSSRCPHCKAESLEAHVSRHDHWTNGGVRTEDLQERRRVMTEEDRGAELWSGHLTRDNFHSQNQRNFSSSHKEGVNTRTLSPPARQIRAENIPGHDSPDCEFCHRKVRTADHSMGHYSRAAYKERPGQQPPDWIRSVGTRGETRNVTFDLKNLKVSRRRGRSEAEYSPPSEAERGAGQSGSSPKTKGKLRPQRKNKVHPRRRGEQGGSERDSPRSSKRRRREEKEREKKKKEKKEKSSKKRKEEKSAKEEDAAAEGEEEKETSVTEVKDEGSGQTLDAGGRQLLETQNLHGFQLDAALAQLHSRPPASFPFADRNRTLASPAGSSFPLAGASPFHRAAGSTALLAGAPAHTLTPGLKTFPTVSGEILSSRTQGPAVSSIPSFQTGLALNAGAAMDAPSAPITVLKNPSGQTQNPSVQGTPVLTVAGHVQHLQTAEVAVLQPQAGHNAASPKENLSEQDVERSVATTLEKESNDHNQSEARVHSTDAAPAGGDAGTDSGVQVTSSQAAPPSGTLLQQEYLSEEGGSSPRRKLRLVLPEKTSSRPPTALERKIR